MRRRRAGVRYCHEDGGLLQYEIAMVGFKAVIARRRGVSGLDYAVAGLGWATPSRSLGNAVMKSGRRRHEVWATPALGSTPSPAVVAGGCGSLPFYGRTARLSERLWQPLLPLAAEWETAAVFPPSEREREITEKGE